jgi:nicotinamidase-related amidase
MTSPALLVMDVQNNIVDRFKDQFEVIRPSLRTAIEGARSAGCPVIHVGVGFRPGSPEISPRNRALAGIIGSDFMGIGTPGADFHEAVAPQAGDIVVHKKRVSAFSGSDLDVVLRSLDVTSLVLCGISTSGVVLSTTRQAADMDFELTVLSDACADGEQEVHRVLVETVFPRQAAVLRAEEWVAQL